MSYPFKPSTPHASETRDGSHKETRDSSHKETRDSSRKESRITAYGLYDTHAYSTKASQERSTSSIKSVDTAPSSMAAKSVLKTEASSGKKIQDRLASAGAFIHRVKTMMTSPLNLAIVDYIPLVLLSLLGWFMVTSASMDLGEHWYADPYFFAKRHGAYLLMSALVFLVIIRMPSELWYRLSTIVLLISVLTLLLVIIPGVGREVNGSMRWISLGAVNFQPSELAKIAVIFYISAYLVRRQTEVQTQWMGFLKPLVVLSLFIVLLLFEPDFGAVVVLLGTVLGMMFIGGVKPMQFLLLIVSSVGIGALILISQPYRMQRLLAYLDPWDPEHVLGTSYQLTQSLMAFGRGQWAGVGIGQSIQKQFYLPEAHTDFVFAIWAEETGLLGVSLVLVLLTLLVVQLVRQGVKAQYLGFLFKSYILYGVAVLLSLQIFINLGVNTGLLPTKGLTLPFLSYGGSSLMMTAVVMAVAFRIISELNQKTLIKTR